MAPNWPTFFLFISILMPFSNGKRGEEYKICSSPTSCGPVKDIQYPFSLENSTFCGSGNPWFSLKCDNSSDYPGIGFMAKVRSINTSNRTIVVSRDKYETCGNLGYSGANYTSDIESFKNSFILGADVGLITLFLGCPNNTVTNNASLTCSSLGINVSVHYLDKLEEVGGKCQSSIPFPVSKRALDEFVSCNGHGRTLESVLEEELEGQYIVPNFTACVDCQQSGGVCGSSVDPSPQFVCYYPPENPSHLGLILGLAATMVVLILALVTFCLRKKINIDYSIVMWKGKATTDYQNIEAYLKTHGPLAPRRYTYANIRKMTNSFREKLGEGGYAVVYKGQLSHGQRVAVKLLKESKNTNVEEFINEVASMGRTNHVNVLTLLGFCFEGIKKAFVFEFMPNGSLDKFTHRSINNSPIHQPLPWSTIFDIALGIARGLEYLHRGCNTRIVHFDIKPHNILLDEDFCPKISDFGLARLCPQKESTISMLEARGTIGYIAPEVFCRNFGGVSHKSDVYSYGMMVLDLVCGKRMNYTTCSTCASGVDSSNESCFTQWIYEQVEFWDEMEAVGVMNEDERGLQRKMLLVSLWCTQTYPSNRPSISKVVEMLEGSVESIQIPPKPTLCSLPD